MIKGAAIFAAGAVSGLIAGTVFGLVIGYRTKLKEAEWPLTDGEDVREAR